MPNTTHPSSSILPDSELPSYSHNSIWPNPRVDEDDLEGPIDAPPAYTPRDLTLPTYDEATLFQAGLQYEPTPATSAPRSRRSTNTTSHFRQRRALGYRRLENGWSAEALTTMVGGSNMATTGWGPLNTADPRFTGLRRSGHAFRNARPSYSEDFYAMLQDRDLDRYSPAAYCRRERFTHNNRTTSSARGAPAQYTTTGLRIPAPPIAALLNRSNRLVKRREPNGQRLSTTLTTNQYTIRESTRPRSPDSRLHTPGPLNSSRTPSPQTREVARTTSKKTLSHSTASSEDDSGNKIEVVEPGPDTALQRQTAFARIAHGALKNARKAGRYVVEIHTV